MREQGGKRILALITVRPPSGGLAPGRAGIFISLFLAIVAPALSPCVARGGTDYLNTVWQYLELGYNIGAAANECLDLDGDGDDEILLEAGVYPDRHFSVWKHVDSTYVPLWTSRTYGDAGISQMEVTDLEGDGHLELFLLQGNGDVELFDAATMSQLAVYHTAAENAVALKIADVDRDGFPDFVVIGHDYLQVYDAITLAPEWTSGAYGGFDLEVGDVDGDGAIEIIVSNGGSSWILDGASHAVKWAYPGFFGSQIDLGNVDADPEPEIVGLVGGVTAFDGLLHYALWSIATDGVAEALLVTDVEKDGTADLFLGDNQWGYISRYSVVTKKRLWYIANPEHGVTAMSVGDPDHDGVPEVTWTAGHSSGGADRLFIAGMDSRQIEWQSLDLDAPFYVSVCDLNHDGQLDIVGGCYGRNSQYGGGFLMAFNGTSQLMDWSTGLVYGNLLTLEAANINASSRGEIVFGEEDRIAVVDGITHARLGVTSAVAGTRDLAVADVDADGAREIAAVDGMGYIHVFDGETLAEEWKSDQTPFSFGGVSVAQCDTDRALEIVRYQHAGKVEVFDGLSHLLEWQSSGISGVTALTAADLDLDGDQEIITGHIDGRITVIDGLTHIIQLEDSVSSEAITGICVANLDSAYGQEIVIGSSRMTVLSGDSLIIKWQSFDLGYGVGDVGNLTACDVDRDGFMDVLAGSGLGIIQFESSARYPDVTPPAIISRTPNDGQDSVGIEAELRALVSEPIDETTLASGILLLDLSARDTLPVSARFDSTTGEVVVTPLAYLPPRCPIQAEFLGTVTDLNGLGLDGNGNGISDGSPDDDMVWSFSTAASRDSLGPVVVAAGLNRDSLWRGMELVLDATIEDDSASAVSYVAYAECFMDSIGASGTGMALSPDDDEFNSLSEAVRLSLATEGWSYGDHILFLHARDAVGNWGPPAGLSLRIVPESASRWTQFGCNAQHTGFNPLDSTPTPLRLRWASHSYASPLHPVAVAGDHVLVTPNQTAALAGVTCLDQETGNLVWSLSLGFGSVDPPSVAYGCAYVQTDRTVVCFSLLDGAMVWQASYLAYEARQHFAPTIADGRVFVNAGFWGGMYGFDAFTGKTLWMQSMQASDRWTPAVYQNSVYGFAAGQLTVVNAATGQVQWGMGDLYSTLSPYSTNAAPVIDTLTRLLFLNSERAINAVQLDSHSFKYTKVGPFSANPAVQGGLLYTIWHGDLVVYDELTGHGAWTFDAGATLAYPPAISSRYAFVSSPSRCYAINLSTHQSEWSYPVGGYLTVSDHHLYVASSSGTLYAFEGEPVATAEPPGDRIGPNTFAVWQNFPNPFNAETLIRYTLPEPGRVIVEVFNVLGQRVDRPVDEDQLPGEYLVHWRPHQLASGLYFYVVRAGEHKAIKKMLLLK